MALYLTDFRIGDDYLQQITVLAIDEDGLETAENITGYKFWLTVKRAFTDADTAAVLQISTTAGDHPADDPENGIVHLYVPASLTKTVAAGEYYYDIQMKQPGADGEGITTLLPPPPKFDDLLVFYPEITKATA